MGEFNLLENILNICRSITDVLHICMYLLLIIIAVLIAVYKFDKNDYKNYIYSPIIKFLSNRYPKIAAEMKFLPPFNRSIFKASQWRPLSNRLTYHGKKIKKILKIFKK